MTISCGRRAAAALVLALSVAAGLPARADDLTGNLEQVGAEYARAYLAPFTATFGPNLNSGIFSTAAIPGSHLTFDFGVKVMATQLAASDETFQKVIPSTDLGAWDAAFTGQTGDIVLSGPTVFGDPDTPGTATGYVNGVQVFSQATIGGLVKSSYSPVAVPQVTLGGIKGLRATVRWLPEIALSDDVGKLKLFGWGLQLSANGFLPNLPVDVMAGFFRQTLDVGTLFNARAGSVFVAAGKTWSPLTLYGGYARESSKIDISYTAVADGQGIAFTVDGAQKSRLTVGATLDLLARFNFEMGHGDVTTYTAGLLFGF